MRAPALVSPIRAELTKISTVPALWIALTVTLATNSLLGWAAGIGTVRISSGEGMVPLAQAGALLLAPVYVFVAVGVFAAGTEYGSGQLSASLLAVPGRSRLFAAKLIATVVAAAVAALVVVAPGFVLLHRHDLAAGTFVWRPALAELGSHVVVYLLLAVVGLGLACMVRNVVVPMIVLIVAALLAAPMLRGSFPDVVAVLPHDAALSAVGTPSGPDALVQGAGFAVLAAWGVALTAAAWIAFSLRDA